MLNENLIETCCSLNDNLNNKIYLSCNLNEIIHLNLIEIYYNSNEYCSTQLNCCKTKTTCSRRITKYSYLNCQNKNSCFIDKTCLKIYSSCSSIYGLYGQFIQINYSCLTINQTLSNEEEEEIAPFIVKLSTYNDKLIKKKDLKSSPIFLIIIIIVFFFLMFIIYYLANLIGKKFCRQNKLKNSSIETKILYEYLPNEKSKVQSNNSIPINKIYPTKTNYQYYNTYEQFNPYYYQKFINVQHDPLTGRFYSRTFYPYQNYYY